MGGAQPLSVTLNGGVVLAIDVDRTPHRAPRRDALLRHAHRKSRRSAGAVRSGAPRRPRPLRRPRRQLRRCAAGDRAPRRAGRCGHRPDQRARSAQWLCSAGTLAERSSGAPRSAIPKNMSAAPPHPWSSTSTPCSPCSAPAPSPSTTATTFAASPSTPAAPMPFSFPASCPNTFARSSAPAQGPFRWVALSGDPQRHRPHRRTRA